MTKLSPMLVQYLVGLCCVRTNPASVDVIVGDMVFDTAADKKRDVDVTVTLVRPDGSVEAIKAVEVKRESEPLDVTTVEQLCMKFADMPTVTERAIVSASGFTTGAIKKADKHGVRLYELKPWVKPLGEQFPSFSGIGPPKEFLKSGGIDLLCWCDHAIQVTCETGSPSFSIENATPLFAADGGSHKNFQTFEVYSNALLLRSTQTLFQLEPAVAILRTFPLESLRSPEDLLLSPAWPHTHTIEVLEDQIFMKPFADLVRAKSVTISGKLQWQRHCQSPDFYLIEGVSQSEIFAGAAVMAWPIPEGQMTAFIFAPDSRDMHVQTFQLLEKHKNAIRRLRLEAPTAVTK